MKEYVFEHEGAKVVLKPCKTASDLIKLQAAHGRLGAVQNAFERAKVLLDKETDPVKLYKQQQEIETLYYQDLAEGMIAVEKFFEGLVTEGSLSIVPPLKISELLAGYLSSQVLNGTEVKN